MCETDILREYIAVYVDDLLTAAKDHEKIIKALQGGHKLQHKELGALAYHTCRANLPWCNSRSYRFLKSEHK
jgi:hypothetical protein